jgi:phage tail-like protein
MKREEIRRLLPAVFQSVSADETPLGALLGLMEALHAPTEERLAMLDEILDPARTPEAFVPVLARWVDLDPELAIGTGRLRSLVAFGAELAQRRGTARGLVAFLEAATGATGFQVEDAVADALGEVKPFHLRVTAPKALQAHQELIETIVRREKPAYVSVEPLAFK